MSVPASSLSVLHTPLALLAIGTDIPSQNQCRVWDDAFRTSFLSSLVGGLILSLALYLVLPFIARWWWITQPYVRAFASSLALIVWSGRILLAAQLALNWGYFVPTWISGIPQGYLKCTMNFGAKKVLGWGGGGALIYNLQLMDLIFLVALVAWISLTLIVTFLLSKSGLPSGLRRYLKSGGV